MKKFILWAISILCVLIVLGIGVFKEIKKYYKEHDVKPDVTCEIEASAEMTYSDTGECTISPSDISADERAGLKEDCGMTDDAIDDFYENADHYYRYIIKCVITNNSVFEINIDSIKKFGTEGLYWAETSFPNLGMGPCELMEYGTMRAATLELWVKDIKPEPGFEKKILKLLENNSFKVSYQKVYEGFDRYFAPNNTYYTDNVLVHQPE